MSIEALIAVGVTLALAALAAAVSFGAMRGTFRTEISNLKEMFTSMKKDVHDEISGLHHKVDEIDERQGSSEGWRKAHEAVHADRDRLMTPAFGRHRT